MSISLRKIVEEFYEKIVTFQTCVNCYLKYDTINDSRPPDIDNGNQEVYFGI